MKEIITELISEKEIKKRINELGDEISKAYYGKEIRLIGILKGGAMFACELAKRIQVPVIMDFMQAQSYGSGTYSSGEVRIVKDLDMPIEGCHVLIAEDIIDTGNTIAALTSTLLSRGASDISVCALLDKPSRRVQKKVTPDYLGFSIPDKFVVGMGLDYDQKYRNLPYVGCISFEEE
ncbi:MAG: hypoxanthine phosphoribosyltransferase [Lachnospiraceae bacterium]|nr:hypoxanthine phosphoribosyltransferase [Lachnospiraceae bacterium]MBQ3967812.1 hypoxanthine phosphoribosyltransferase [Lachnospiraceae bacterium]MBR4586722.1 hypoxanthine phosphoribosyltransferase [Lachnospiraceae bacterium]